MAKPLQNDLRFAVNAINGNPGGIQIGQLVGKDATAAQRKAMLRHLKRLADEGRITIEGVGRGTRYKPAATAIAQASNVLTPEANGAVVPLSRAGQTILKAVRAPLQKRIPVGYNRDFLESYVPNKTFYLSKAARQSLKEVGQTDLPNEPAGTYAKQIIQRLLIDLAFHSSRLEGNTYSLLDTKRLLELGQIAQGKADQETQMILNHKDAIDFLVSDAEEVGFNRHTLLNLHGLLANNLLDDPNAVGRLRWIGVGVGGSVYKPLEIPQVISEVFDQILHSASVISDPFEQAFFVLVHLPYLQPFEDVNKRVSRLAANIPLIKANLRPLSFVDVPKDIYTSGILGVHELNRIELLRDVFVWAYQRSAQQYAAVRNTLGEPDAFKLRHREALRALIAEIIQTKRGKKDAVEHIEIWSEANVPQTDRRHFTAVVESELIGLHEGNFVRYRVKPSEFAAWKKIWAA